MSNHVEDEMSLGPALVPFSKIRKLQFKKPFPIIMTFTEDEWKKSIEGIEISQIPVSFNGIRFASVKIPKELGLGDRVALPICPNDKPNIICFPRIRNTPHGQIIIDCTCLPTDSDSEGKFTKKPLQEEPNISCKLVINKVGKLQCEGKCEKGECLLLLNIMHDGTHLCGCKCTTKESIKKIIEIYPNKCGEKGGIVTSLLLRKTLPKFKQLNVKIGNNEAIDVVLIDPYTISCNVPPGNGDVDAVIFDGNTEVFREPKAFSYEGEKQ